MAKAKQDQPSSPPQQTPDALALAQEKLSHTKTDLHQTPGKPSSPTHEMAEAPALNEPEGADIADEAQIQQLQAQQCALDAKACEIDAQASRLRDESNGSESSEVEQARKQAQEMRGAAEQARGVIASATTDSKGRKRISSAALKGVATAIEHAAVDADHEVTELGAVLTEVRFRNSKRETARPEAKKKTISGTVSAAFLGLYAGGGAGQYASRDDEDTFTPLMNRMDRHNHDGIISGREMSLGGVGLIRALGSKKKLATYGRLVGEMQDAVKADDVRGMHDVARDVGLGVQNTTGSQDLGYVATTVVGTGITKTDTAGKLLTNFDVWGIAGSAGRLVNTWGGIATDAVGMNTLANQIRPLLAQINSSDLKYRVNDKRVKQFDTDGNGVIDAPEIIGVLRNNGVASMDAVDKDKDGKLEYGELAGMLYHIARQNHTHVEGRSPAQPAKPNPNQGKKVTLDGFGQVSIEQARDIMLAKDHHIKIDKNGDGITYGEAFAAVQQWNATHTPDGHLVPSASPAHTKPTHGQAPRPNK